MKPENKSKYRAVLELRRKIFKSSVTIREPETVRRPQVVFRGNALTNKIVYPRVVSVDPTTQLMQSTLGSQC